MKEEIKETQTKTTMHRLKGLVLCKTKTLTNLDQRLPRLSETERQRERNQINKKIKNKEKRFLQSTVKSKDSLDSILKTSFQKP